MDDALRHLSKNDPVLRQLITTYPKPSFIKHTDYYQELVSSVIGQQLSLAAARAIEGRFKDLFDGAFPTPEQILTVDIETLRSVGFSRPKARYVQDLAQKIIDGEVTFSDFDHQTNEEIISELIQVKGIGEWTVHMFLMFCIARMNVLPVGDLGIRNGVTILYSLPEQATPDDVTIIAEKNNWRPYESIASWYVWQSLENSPATS